MQKLVAKGMAKDKQSFTEEVVGLILRAGVRSHQKGDHRPCLRVGGYVVEDKATDEDSNGKE